MPLERLDQVGQKAIVGQLATYAESDVLALPTPYCMCSVLSAGWLILTIYASLVLSHQADDGHDFSFKIGESEWSHVRYRQYRLDCQLIVGQVLNVEAPTAESAVVIQSTKSKQDEVHIGVSWTEGLGKYKLSKVITLAPRFIIKNNLGAPITFREHGVAPRERSTIDVGERCPLISLRNTQEKLLTIAYSGLNAHWYVVHLLGQDTTHKK